MARARNIKPGLFKNEILGVADPLFTIVFEGLWVLADKEGRLEDRPLRIKAEVLPYREGVDIDAILEWLQSAGFIRRYAVAGKGYIVVLEFKKHQNPHKNESESELPPPDDIGTTSEKIGSTRADSLNSDSLNSDSLTAGAAAPPADGGKTPEQSAKEELWTAGKSYLIERGVAPSQAGSFIGGLAKKYTSPIVVEVVREMLVEMPADPKGWVVAACQHKAGQRAPPEPSWRAEQRQRTQQAAPGVAAGAPADQFFIDVEARRVPARTLG